MLKPGHIMLDLEDKKAYLIAGIKDDRILLRHLDREIYHGNLGLNPLGYRWTVIEDLDWARILYGDSNEQ